MFGKKRKNYEEAERCLQKVNEMAQENGFNDWESFCESIEKKENEKQEQPEMSEDGENVLEILREVEQTIDICQKAVRTWAQ